MLLYGVLEFTFISFVRASLIEGRRQQHSFDLTKKSPNFLATLLSNRKLAVDYSDRSSNLFVYLMICLGNCKIAFQACSLFFRSALTGASLRDAVREIPSQCSAAEWQP